MVEGGQGPEILIAGKDTSIEEIRRRAEATSVNPNEPLPKAAQSSPEQPQQKAEEPKEKRKRPGISAVGALLIEEGLEAVGEWAKTKRETGRERRETRRKEKEVSRSAQEPFIPPPQARREEVVGSGTPKEEAARVESKPPEPRSFYEILEDKRQLLQGPPDEAKENALIMENARLVRSAKDANIFHYLKQEMAEIQTYNDYKVAREKIHNIHIGNYELQARGFGADWDPRYEGMLAEYRDVALLNMDLAMLRAKGQGDSDDVKKLEREIHLRGWGSPPIQGLEGMARKYLEVDTQVSERRVLVGSEIPGGEAFEQIVDAIRKGQKEGTAEAFKVLAAQQAQEFREAFGSLPIEEERANWVDLEYRQDFWTRFEPRSWPRFYEKMGFQERRLWDARWQLARATFFKRVTAAFPDKYVENQDLALLGKDQMEILFGIEGVPDMLKSYADLLIAGDRIAGLSIWDCKDQDTFEKIRQGLRDNLLKNPKYFQGDTDEIKALRAKEADAVAWNLLNVSLLPESIDSRYSYTGGKHGDLPGAIIADEYRTILHPQERAETKWAAKHNEWGTFGPWGSTQMAFIEKASGFNSTTDEWLVTPADRNHYWRHRRTNEKPSDPRKREKDGRVFEVFMPEVYPVVTTGSFLEETRAGDKTLLEHIIESGGKNIPWADVKADAWVIYMTGKFNKAVKLFEYWSSGVPINLAAYGGAKEWSGPLKEIMIQRLKLGRVIEGLRRDNKTHQTFHNLKVLPIYAASGGVKDVTSTRPEPNLTREAKKIIVGGLRSSQIGYLDRREGLDLD